MLPEQPLVNPPRDFLDAINLAKVAAAKRIFWPEASPAHFALLPVHWPEPGPRARRSRVACG